VTPVIAGLSALPTSACSTSQLVNHSYSIGCGWDGAPQTSPFFQFSSGTLSFGNPFRTSRLVISGVLPPGGFNSYFLEARLTVACFGSAPDQPEWRYLASFNLQAAALNSSGSFTNTRSVFKSFNDFLPISTFCIAQPEHTGCAGSFVARDLYARFATPADFAISFSGVNGLAYSRNEEFYPVANASIDAIWPCLTANSEIVFRISELSTCVNPLP
jgi:hypothetical protein